MSPETQCTYSMSVPQNGELYMRPASSRTSTVGGVLLDLRRRPGLLLSCWNWKSALFSSLFRSQIFLAANLSAGRRAAVMAMAAEFAYRAVVAGFYGAITQAFRSARPAWLALTSVLLLLPALGHAIELLVHWLRGTPNLRASILASVAFTYLSTAFHWYAMRRGTLVVGEDGRSLAADIRSLPGVLFAFVTAPVQAAVSVLSKSKDPVS